MNKHDKAIDTERMPAVAQRLPSEIESLLHTIHTVGEDNRYLEGVRHAIAWLFDVTVESPIVTERPIHAPTGETLIHLPYTRACIRKWNAGRRRYGPDFCGDPLAQLFEEMLDGQNYADEAALQGVAECIDIGERLREIAIEVQGLYDLRVKGHLEASA